MNNTADNKKLEQNKSKLFWFVILTLVFFSGASFTYVIPFLKGFNLFLFVLGLGIYVFIGDLLVKLIANKTSLIFLSALILSTLGMGWRVWLEWGEYSLIEHTKGLLLIGYPFIISLIITLTYIISKKINVKRSGGSFTKHTAEKTKKSFS